MTEGEKEGMREEGKEEREKRRGRVKGGKDEWKGREKEWSEGEDDKGKKGVLRDSKEESLGSV